MRKGFTLIELLLVVVIIGILAALVLPKFSSVKEKAYVASMKSDLRNLATAQEIYMDSYNEYQTGTADQTNAVADFKTSKDVSIVVSSSTPKTTYTAVASHNKSATKCTFNPGEAVSCN